MIITKEQMNKLWDIYDRLGELFGYCELYDLRELIDELEE